MESGAAGRAGDGTSLFQPLLFPTEHQYHHDQDNGSPPMAVARVGGAGGPVWVYAADEPAHPGWTQGSFTFAGGGKRWF